MYPVSNDYLNAIFNDERDTRITGTIKLKNGTTITIDNESIAEAPSISNQCVNDTEIKLGQAYQAQLDISIYSNVDRYKIYGATVILSHGVKVSSDPDVWEDVPLGKYKVKECIRTSNNILKITALDEMDKLDLKYVPGMDLSGEPYNILRIIAVSTGMTLSQTREEIRSLPNGTKTGFQMREKYRSTTWRDVLGDMVALLAGNAILDREGKIYVQSFATIPVLEMPADARTKESISDYEVVYTSASCLRRKTLVSVGTDNGQDISLDANDFIQKNSQGWAEDVLQEILDAISPLRYTPSDISWYGDPALDLGDLIKATGSAASTSTLIPIQKFKWTWRGEHQIISVGKNPYLSETQSLTDKRLNKISEDESGRIDFALYSNPYPITVTHDAYVEVGSVNFALSEDTDVEAWLEVKLKSTYDVNKLAGIGFHYFLDGTEQNYHPVEEWQDQGATTDFTLDGTTLVFSTNSSRSENIVHTLNYQYHLSNVSSGTSHIWKVMATGLNGTQLIDIGDVRIVLWATGLIGDQDWEGNLQAEDTLPVYPIGYVGLIGELDEVVTVDLPETVKLLTENGDALITEAGDDIAIGSIELLPNATTLEGTEYIPIVQNGTTVKVSTQDVADFGNS